MEKRKFEKLLVVSLSCLVLAIALNIYGLSKGFNFQLVVNLLAIAVEAAYFLDGYRKKSNKLFRAFMGFLTVKEGYALLSMTVIENQSFIPCFIVLVIYSGILVLAVGKDLGKRVSFIIGYAVVFLSLICVISGAVIVPPTNSLGILILVYNLTRLIINLELLVMLIAKYRDKHIRHTN